MPAHCAELHSKGTLPLLVQQRYFTGATVFGLTHQSNLAESQPWQCSETLCDPTIEALVCFPNFRSIL